MKITKIEKDPVITNFKSKKEDKILSVFTRGHSYIHKYESKDIVAFLALFYKNETTFEYLYLSGSSVSVNDFLVWKEAVEKIKNYFRLAKDKVSTNNCLEKLIEYCEANDLCYLLSDVIAELFVGVKSIENYMVSKGKAANLIDIRYLYYLLDEKSQDFKTNLFIESIVYHNTNYQKKLMSNERKIAETEIELDLAAKEKYTSSGRYYSIYYCLKAAEEKIYKKKKLLTVSELFSLCHYNTIFLDEDTIFSKHDILNHFSSVNSKILNKAYLSVFENYNEIINSSPLYKNCNDIEIWGKYCDEKRSFLLSYHDPNSDAAFSSKENSVDTKDLKFIADCMADLLGPKEILAINEPWIRYPIRNKNSIERGINDIAFMPISFGFIKKSTFNKLMRLTINDIRGRKNSYLKNAYIYNTKQEVVKMFRTPFIFDNITHVAELNLLSLLDDFFSLFDMIPKTNCFYNLVSTFDELYREINLRSVKFCTSRIICVARSKILFNSYMRILTKLHPQQMETERTLLVRSFYDSTNYFISPTFKKLCFKSLKKLYTENAITVSQYLIANILAIPQKRDLFNETLKEIFEKEKNLKSNFGRGIMHSLFYAKDDIYNASPYDLLVKIDEGIKKVSVVKNAYSFFKKNNVLEKIQIKHIYNPDDFGITPQMLAANHSLLEFLQDFKPTDLEATDKRGWGLLNYAIASGSLETVKYVYDLYEKQNLIGSNLPIKQAENIYSSYVKSTNEYKNYVIKMTKNIRDSHKYVLKFSWQF